MVEVQEQNFEQRMGVYTSSVARMSARKRIRVEDELVAIGLPDDSDCAGEGGSEEFVSRCSGEQLG